MLEAKLIRREGFLPTRSPVRWMPSGWRCLTISKRGRNHGEQKLRLTPALYGTPYGWKSKSGVRLLTAEIQDYTGAVTTFLRVCGKLPDKVLDKLSGNLVDLKGVKGRLEAAVENLLFFVSRDEDSATGSR